MYKQRTSKASRHHKLTLWTPEDPGGSRCGFLIPVLTTVITTPTYQSCQDTYKHRKLCMSPNTRHVALLHSITDTRYYPFYSLGSIECFHKPLFSSTHNEGIHTVLTYASVYGHTYQKRYGRSNNYYSVVCL